MLPPETVDTSPRLLCAVHISFISQVSWITESYVDGVGDEEEAVEMASPIVALAMVSSEEEVTAVRKRIFSGAIEAKYCRCNSVMWSE